MHSAVKKTRVQVGQYINVNMSMSIDIYLLVAKYPMLTCESTDIEALLPF